MQVQATCVTSSTRCSVVAIRLSARPACSTPFRRASVIRCTARPVGEDQLQTMPQRIALPLAAALAGAMLVGAAVPEDAMAARSGGRMGGSSFSRSRSAPPRRAPARSGATYNTYIAPPVYGGVGGYGYGGGMPFLPIFAFGGFFQFIIGMVVVSTVFNVIRSIASPGDSRKDSDTWDD